MFVSPRGMSYPSSTVLSYCVICGAKIKEISVTLLREALHVSCFHRLICICNIGLILHMSEFTQYLFEYYIF